MNMARTFFLCSHHPIPHLWFCAQKGALCKQRATACRKNSPAAIFSDRTRFPCAFSAAGETRRETLLRKASESTAHV
ncbi:MAG: hypothetical protein KHX34_07450, partial [Clostridiales bacterium]|nr:hypothetical protein [Clostridiales bacterium]